MFRNARAFQLTENDKGFMLIEFLIALFIFTIAFLALAKMAYIVASGNLFAQQMTIAMNGAQSKLDEFKTMSFTDPRLDTGEDVVLGLRRFWIVQHDIPSQDMKMVTVTVTWGTPTRSVALSTIISKESK